jgi:predicted  nucleic acid-binding Zn-ribbon protein
MPLIRTNIQKQIQALVAVENLSWNVRTVLRKTSKAFKQLHAEKAHSSTELDHRKRQMEQLQSKRRKKMTIDPNRRFTNIEDIKKTQDEIQRRRSEYERHDRQREAAETSAALLREDINSFIHEFWVIDGSEAVNNPK